MGRNLVLGVALLLGVACAGQTAGGQGGAEDQAKPATGPATIEVQAEDFKYGGVPATLPAGRTTFTLENVGQEPHEFSLVRIQSDQAIEELIRLPQKEAEEFVEFLGGTFAKPGDTGKPYQIELQAGRYGYVCFVESKDVEPHAFKGMYGEFTVE